MRAFSMKSISRDTNKNAKPVTSKALEAVATGGFLAPAQTKRRAIRTPIRFLIPKLKAPYYPASLAKIHWTRRAAGVNSFAKL
jgi:hypothetical protein